MYTRVDTMRLRCRITTIVFALTFLSLVAQKSPAQSKTDSNTGPTSTSEALAPGTVIFATLNSKVDAARAKPGDVITAEVHGDNWGETKIVIPDHCKVVGRIVEAQPLDRAHAQSKLAVTFEKAVLKNGNEVPLRALVNRMTEEMPPVIDLGPGTVLNDARGGQPRGSIEKGNAAEYTSTHPIPPAARPAANKSIVTSNSGLLDVDLSSAITPTSIVSVLTSERHTVRIPKHMDIYLEVVGTAAPQQP
jgi:hypothetical protein